MEKKSLTYLAPAMQILALHAYHPIAQSNLHDMPGTNPVDPDEFEID